MTEVDGHADDELRLARVALACLVEPGTRTVIKRGDDAGAVEKEGVRSSAAWLKAKPAIFSLIHCSASASFSSPKIVITTAPQTLTAP